MAGNDGRMHFKADIDYAGLKESAAKVNKILKGIGDNAEREGDKIDKLGKKLKIAIGSAFTIEAARRFVREMVQVRGQFQQIEIAFTTIIGSAERANNLMEQLTKSAVTTPFQMTDLAQGAKQLMAYGIEAEKVNDLLLRLGDIAAGLSIPLGDLVYLYGTSMTQGRLYAMDMRQLMGRGIPIAEQLAKQMGVAKEALDEMVSAGKVTSEEFHKAMMAIADGKFANLMEKQAQSFTGKISNIRDALDVMFNEIGRSQEGPVNAILSGTIKLIENYKKVGAIVAELIAAYGAYKAALLVNAALSSKFVSVLKIKRREMALLNATAKALNATLLKNPFALVAAGVGAAAVAVWQYTQRVKEANDVQARLKEGASEIEKTMDDQRSKAEELITTIKDETATRLQQAQALAQLQEIYPTLFRNMDIEAVKLMDILKLKKLINGEVDRGTEAAYRERIEELRIMSEHKAKEERLLFLARAAGGRVPIGYKEEKTAFEALPIEERKALIKKYKGRTSASLLEELKGAKGMLKNLREEAAKVKKTEMEVKPVLNLTYWNQELERLTQSWETLTAEEQRSAVGKEILAKIRKAEAEIERLKVPRANRSSVNKEAEAEKELLKLKEERLAFEQRIRKEQEQADNSHYIESAKDAADKMERELAVLLDGIAEQKQEYIKSFGASVEEANRLFAKSETQAMAKSQREMEAYYEELREKYATYEQQRTKITEEAERDRQAFRDRAREEGDPNKYDLNIQAVTEVEQENLKSLDLLFAMKDDEFKAWADKVVNLSLEEINKMIDLAILNLQSLKESGATTEEVGKANATLQQLREAKERVKAPQGATSSWKELQRTLQSVVGTFKEIGDEVGGVTGEIIAGAGEIATTTLQMINGIVSLAELSVQATTRSAQGASKAINQVERASVILTIIGTGLRVIQKVANFFTKNTELSNEQVSSYNALIKATNDLAAANRQLMASMSGSDAFDKMNESVHQYRSTIEATRRILVDWLNSGASKGFMGIGSKASHGVKARKALEPYREELEKIGIYWDNIIGSGRMEGLAQLTTNQLEAMKKNTYLWSKLPEEVRQYYETILSGEKNVREAAEEGREAITGLTFDSLQNEAKSLVETLATMEDIPKSFEKLMRQALLRTLMNAGIQEQVRAWQEQLQAATLSGGVLTKAEGDELRAQWQTIIEEAQRRYRSQLQALGIEMETDEDKRQGARKGIAQASQDSIDELNGRFTAIQGHTYAIMQHTDKLTHTSASILAHLVGIHTNTNELRRLQQIETRLSEVSLAIEGINTRGVRIRG